LKSSGARRGSVAELRGRLGRRLKRAGQPLPADQVERLAEYLDLLSTWNERINLTALQDVDEAIDRLILEPVLAARHIAAGAAVLDIGSGSGSPAIPLKVVVPGTSLCMVESKTRKSAFLREAVRQLALTSVRVETCRYEELLAAPDFHESVDVVTVRAVRMQASMLLGLQAFLRDGGQLLLFKGAAGLGAEPPPPLRLEADEPLVESLRSRLVRVRKHLPR
jgi:16S rRNA (guanine527-N7)-methyltransferase